MKPGTFISFPPQVPHQILIEAAVANRGMPIPRRDIEAAGQAASISSQPFGDGSSAGSTNMGTSPGLQPAAPMAIQVSQPVMQLQPQQQQQQVHKLFNLTCWGQLLYPSQEEFDGSNP